ncbi:MAG: hypothetical protein QW645_01365, partial [Candidatus Bathyarchaeia archaeon]
MPALLILLLLNPVAIASSKPDPRSLWDLPSIHALPLDVEISQPKPRAPSASAIKPSINKVTIDGKWTAPDEWRDATEFPEDLGCFLIKRDESFLYVLIDFIKDATPDDGDCGRVRLDINNDKSDALQPDDYMISLDWRGGVAKKTIYHNDGKIWKGMEGDPLGVEAASTNDAANDPYSTSPHMIYEFAIPMGIFGDRSEI